MTEQGWFDAQEPEVLLRSLGCHPSQRKLRLFAVACCRRIWEALTDGRSRQAVNVAERFADGQATAEELDSALWEAACDVTNLAVDAVIVTSVYQYERTPSSGAGTGSKVTLAPNFPVEAAIAASWKAARGDKPSEQQAQAELVRDIFRNPLSPLLRVVPSWLFWEDRAVQRIALEIYERRTYADLPVLADALEEAGCTYSDVLRHCREPKAHVRGCWVLDLLLGKD
jgi:hypothetical protein